MLDCVVLAGGSVIRKESDIPKCLVKIIDKPILEHQLSYLEIFQNINKIIIAIDYKSELIENYLRVRRKGPKNISSSIDEEPRGTAGALKKALEKVIMDYLLVLNCDDLTDINPEVLEQLTRGKNENIICRAHTKAQYGEVPDRPDGYVDFIEKPEINDRWFNCGWYLFKREIEKVLPDTGSLETDIFPFSKGLIKMIPYNHTNRWLSFNSEKDIEEFIKKFYATFR